MTTAFLLVLFFSAFDIQNVFAVYRGWTLGPADATSDDYTIIVPVYGHRRYFEQRGHLEHLRERVLVSLDTAGIGMPGLADELEAEGWQVHRTRLPVPGPPMLVLDALESGRIATTYAFRMDADTFPIDDPGRYVERMRMEGVQYASVRVHVRSPGRFVEKMQAVEYRMAMRARRLRPWLSSGACFGGEAEALRRVLSLHSMWFPGEDLEAGRIALALRLNYRHLELEVETEAPDTWRRLFRQRRSWWAGGFRHAVVNADKNIRHTPIWSVYYLGLVMIGFLLKVDNHLHIDGPLELFVYLGVLFAVYAALTVIANWAVRSWWMLLYPPFALLQTLGMPTVGFLSWGRRAVGQRHLGRYRFGLARGIRLRTVSHPVGGAALPVGRGRTARRMTVGATGIAMAGLVLGASSVWMSDLPARLTASAAVSTPDRTVATAPVSARPASTPALAEPRPASPATQATGPAEAIFAAASPREQEPPGAPLLPEPTPVLDGAPPSRDPVAAVATVPTSPPGGAPAPVEVSPPGNADASNTPVEPPDVAEPPTITAPTAPVEASPADPDVPSPTVPTDPTAGPSTPDTPSQEDTEISPSPGPDTVPPAEFER